jgi:hypothetical protein
VRISAVQVECFDRRIKHHKFRLIIWTLILVLASVVHILLSFNVYKLGMTALSGTA